MLIYKEVNQSCGKKTPVLIAIHIMTVQIKLLFWVVFHEVCTM